MCTTRLATVICQRRRLRTPEPQVIRHRLKKSSTKARLIEGCLAETGLILGPDHSDHPRRVAIRQDTLVSLIREFFDARVFGPDRRELLATQIPATDAQAAEQNARQ